jgi:hypothetical protein
VRPQQRQDRKLRIPQPHRRQVAIVQAAQMASALPGCEGVTETKSAWCCHAVDITVQLHSVKWICAPTTLSGQLLTLAFSNGCSRVTSECRISPKGSACDLPNRHRT